MNTSIMEQVPQHFMGRVQNTFYFAGTALQMVLGFLVGAVAQSIWSRDSPSSAGVRGRLCQRELAGEVESLPEPVCGLGSASVQPAFTSLHGAILRSLEFRQQG